MYQENITEGHYRLERIDYGGNLNTALGQMRYRTPKQFRHTYAHRMLTAGKNLASISTELGYKNVAVIARVYAGFVAELEGRGFGTLAAERYGEDGKNMAGLTTTD